MPKRRTNNFSLTLASTLAPVLCFLFAGCVSHHTIHLDPQNKTPDFARSSFKLLSNTPPETGRSAKTVLSNDTLVADLLVKILQESGYQRAADNTSPDFLVSIFSDYLPPGSKPPALPQPTRLPDPQIVIGADELGGLDPNKKDYWRLILELYDPATHDLIWSGYAETAHPQHFRSPRNQRAAIESLVKRLPR